MRRNLFQYIKMIPPLISPRLSGIIQTGPIDSIKTFVHCKCDHWNGFRLLESNPAQFVFSGAYRHKPEGISLQTFRFSDYVNRPLKRLRHASVEQWIAMQSLWETYRTKLISVNNDRKLCDVSTSEFYSMERFTDNFNQFTDTSCFVFFST